MRVKFADKIEAIADPRYESGRLKPHLAKLFAKAQVQVPLTGKVDMPLVDRALAGLSIEARLIAKSELAAAGVIA